MKSTVIFILKILALLGMVQFLPFAFMIFFLTIAPFREYFETGLFVFPISELFGLILTILIYVILILAIFTKKNLKKRLLWLSVCAGICICVLTGHSIYYSHQQSLKIDTSPNINVHDYLPFEEDSKITPLEEASTLKLTQDLPILDGAAAVFPVYSAFVNAVYPETTELFEGVFEYNNTVSGYEALAKKNTDIFFGGYPSQEQLDYAAEHGTEFCFTPIAYEAFVFFVHKDNPIDSLTSQQVRDIYSGKVTNWKQVGGSDTEIVAFQRNEGSGSQSQMLRFMGDTPIMEPPKELINGLMDGIVEEVAQYTNTESAIGYSFRFYLEGIIRNPDIKLLKIDGIAPTTENIQNNAYPIVGPLYAVTWKDNPNKNVQILLDWILGPQGQQIIKNNGYTPISK